MSADTLDTLTEVTGARQDIWQCETVHEALKARKPAGTMRAWMSAHNGQKVTTIQVNWSTWAPTGRTIDASRSSYVTFDGSRQDYAGMSVIHADETTLIVDSEHCTAAYVIED